jgi:hypothetical protein
MVVPAVRIGLTLGRPGHPRRRGVAPDVGSRRLGALGVRPRAGHGLTRCIARDDGGTTSARRDAGRRRGPGDGDIRRVPREALRGLWRTRRFWGRRRWCRRGRPRERQCGEHREEKEGGQPPGRHTRALPPSLRASSWTRQPLAMTSASRAIAGGRSRSPSVSAATRGTVGADACRSAGPGAVRDRDSTGPVRVAGRPSAPVFFPLDGASCRVWGLVVVADVPVVAADTTEPEPAVTTGLLARTGDAVSGVGGMVAAGAGSGVGVRTIRAARVGYGSGCGVPAAASGTGLAPSRARSDTAMVRALVATRRDAAPGSQTLDRRPRPRNETCSLRTSRLPQLVAFAPCPKSYSLSANESTEDRSVRPPDRCGGRAVGLGSDHSSDRITYL